MNIVLMAGGGGTRLWPVSRSNNPKQFLDLGSGKTLIEHTYLRAKELTGIDNIFVATTEMYYDRVRKVLPDIKKKNIFLETEKRDTAPAFAAVAVQLKALGLENEPTIFMWSDHVFTNEKEFVGDLKKISKLVTENPDSIVIMGHTPIFPETGFGYIEVGEKLAGYQDIFHVKAFKEKPDYKTAQKYIASGDYFWNMAYISLLPSYLLEQLREHAPELMSGIDKFEIAIQQENKEDIKKTYADLPKQAIDYALLEKTPRILAVTGDYGWSDVGNWAAVQEVFGSTSDHVPYGHHIHIDSDNNYIYNVTDKQVSMLGVKDTIVIVSEDAILVINKKETARVKEIVNQLEEDGKSNLL